MHQPRPYGRFHEQTELTEADERAIEAMARNLTNFKSVSGLDSLKRVRDLPSGRQAVALDMGGTFRIIVLEKYESPVFQFEGIAATNLPALFSGIITRDMVKEDEGVTIKLTEQARRRLAGYGDNLPPKDVELQRFKIEYHRDFAYFKPRITGIYTFTQYVRQRPTWYSGAMAQVMQVVGGYGRQRFDELPEDDIERARMVLPERYMRRIRQELENVRLPGYTGFPDEEGQFRCDYKFSKCHGVSFDGAGSPWLIELSSHGAFAMPLPIIPATATEAFREYIEDVGDDEILKLLDTFGGMPSGETFPEDQRDFEAWRRAGVIVKLFDTKDFYSKRALYSASGWSFNRRGTEGFNTCWEYDGRGLIQVYAYKIRMRLAQAESRGWIGLDWTFSTSDPEVEREEKQRLDRYLSGIYQQLGANRARELAIKYKIRRHTVAELLELAGDGSQTPDIDYWDSLEMEPIAAHEGSMRQVSSGPAYWGLWMYPQSMGAIKFPALSGEGCESFIMVSPDYRGPSVRCDTIMFGAFIGDDLQVIKYFNDERKFYREEVSSFEPHMIVGRWEKTVTTGNSGLMGYFYTSAFDDRQEAPPVTTRTEIVGTDLGYGNAAYRTPGLLFMRGNVSRSRYYQHLTKTSSTSGFSLSVAVCVPVFTRDCILYAYSDSVSSRKETEETSRGSVPDPTSYELWTYDSIFHYMGRSGIPQHPKPVYDWDGKYVYIDTMTVNPAVDPTGFASSGNWLGLSTYIDVSGMLSPYTSRGSTHAANGVVVGGEAPNFQPYSWEKTYPGESSGRISISFTVAGSTVFSRERPNQFYYDFSPVDAGGSPLYFYRDGIYNAIGDAEYSSISEKDQHGRRVKWGNTSLSDHKSAHHFIGVINE